MRTSRHCWQNFWRQGHMNKKTASLQWRDAVFVCPNGKEERGSGRCGVGILRRRGCIRRAVGRGGLIGGGFAIIRRVLPGTFAAGAAPRRGVRLAVANECREPIAGDVNRLFDRFYRPDASRTAATGGFSIGLSIARSICEAHRGTIRAEMSGETIAFIAELK